MEQHIYRQLQDKQYDKRKAAALDLEKNVADAVKAKDVQRVHFMLSQLDELVSSAHTHIRSGGIIGLTGVAMGVRKDMSPYLGDIIHPILRCFQDSDARTRFYALECMYNVAKIARAHMLQYFDAILDACSKLSADRDPSVHQSIDLVDRVMRDIVAENVGSYSAHKAGHVREETTDSTTSQQASRNAELHAVYEENIRNFSLASFIPLLQERLTIINPYARTFFIQWLQVLAGVPELDLIIWLPSFLRELIVFVSDPAREIALAASNLLADLLAEVHKTTETNEEREAAFKRRQEKLAQRAEREGGASQDVSDDEDDSDLDEDESRGVWEPGQGLQVNHAAIMDILIGHLQSSMHAETQRLCHHWVQEFLVFSQDTVVSFTPRLISAVLPLLASDDPVIHESATRTNEALFRVIAELPRNEPRSRAPSFEPNEDGSNSASSQYGGTRPGSLDGQDHSVISVSDPFDYQRMVNELITQLVPDSETTRIASLEWLVMLHQRVGYKIQAMTKEFFPALLKFLSDQAASDSVIVLDLMLISYISRESDDTSFRTFMRDLLALFGTDRALLERRGSLIIRELCRWLDPDKIYRQCAELLEVEEDLEFASIMVQHLNIQLLTAPTLLEFRKRFKTIDSKDTQGLFVALYRAWSHNAVSTLALCFLAQVYEHTYALLQSFADLEITVSMYTQLDKLVQLLESPIFIALRLQLLEPDRHPFLYKALYAYLMLLPQSTAFSSLRGRLSAVNALGYQHVLPRSSSAASSSTSITSNGPTPSSLRPRKPDENAIKWSELLAHFRATQSKHERARRHTGHHHHGFSAPSAVHSPDPTTSEVASVVQGGTKGRRKTTGGVASTQQQLASSKLATKRISSPPPSATGRRMVSAAAPASRRL